MRVEHTKEKVVSFPLSFTYFCVSKKKGRDSKYEKDIKMINEKPSSVQLQ